VIVASKTEDLKKITFHTLCKFNNKKTTPQTMICRFSNFAISAIALIVFFYSNPGNGLYAQQYAFHSYNEDVLPDLGDISTIFEDSRGIIWIGGNRGVAYYDGEHFHRFSITNGLCSNWCFEIKEAPNGEIWICTWDGISVYNPGNGELSTHPSHTYDRRRDVIFLDEESYFIAMDGGVLLFRNRGHYIIDVGMITVAHDIWFDETRNLLWVATDMNGVVAIDMSDYITIFEMKDKEKQIEYELLGDIEFRKKHSIEGDYLPSDLYVVDNDSDRTKFFQNHIRQYKFLDNTGNRIVYSISSDPENNIWARTSKGLFKLTLNNSDSDIGFKLRKTLMDYTGFLYHFDIDSDGTKYVGSTQGFYVIHENDTLHLSQESGLLSSHITYGMKDTQGVLWLAMGNRLQKLSSKSFTIITEEDYPILEEIKGGISLPDSCVIVYTLKNVLKYSNRTIEPLPIKTRPGEFIIAIYNLGQDLIIATSFALHIISEGKQKTISSDLPFAEYVFFEKDVEGRLWICRDNRVYSWDGYQLEFHQGLPEQGNPVFITFIHSASDTSLFIGTWYGFYRINSKNEGWRYYIGSISYNPDVTNPLYEYSGIPDESADYYKDHVLVSGGSGPDSALWFGTFSGGLIRILGDSIRSYGVEDGLRGKRFSGTYKDIKGNRYFFSEEGVCKITSEEVLPLDFSIQDYPEFYDMKIDSEGRTYFATSRGLLVSSDNMDFFCDLSFGFKESEVLQILTISEDDIILLQPHSITQFDPKLLSSPANEIRQPIITEIWSDSLRISVNATINLPPGQRNIRFRFSLPDYFSESRNRFSWKLSGLDQDFSPYSFKQEVIIERLPPGNYFFHLRTIDGRGRKSQISHPVKVTVPPFFYETISFKIGIGALIIILSLIGFQLRVNQLKRSKQRLENTVEKRTIQLADARDAAVEAYKRLEEAQKQLVKMAREAGMAQIAANVLHNVGNVLTRAITLTSAIGEITHNSRSQQSLKKFAEMIKPHQEKFGDFCLNDPRGKKIPEYVTQLDKAVTEENEQIYQKQTDLQQSMEHIREIISLQEEFTGKGGIEEKTRIHELIENAVHLFETSQKNDSIKIILDVENNNQAIILDRHSFLQILVNLLTNARDSILSTESGSGEIRILALLSVENKLRISITDNGQGINQENMDKIFTYGFTSKPNGHGYGLHGSANIAARFGGTLKAHSEGIGKGATFTLEIPVTIES